MISENLRNRGRIGRPRRLSDAAHDFKNSISSKFSLPLATPFSDEPSSKALHPTVGRRDACIVLGLAPCNGPGSNSRNQSQSEDPLDSSHG